MFNIFKKSSTFKIDAYTCSESAFNYTPVVKAHHTLPSWWVDLPAAGKDSRGFPDFRNRTMKTCVGFVDLFKIGLVVEYWDDLVITVKKDGYTAEHRLQGMPKSGSHPNFQWGRGFPRHHHIKLNSPWLLREKTNIPFLFCPAMWHLDQINAPKIMTGIVNFKYQSQVNINMFLPIREKPYQIKIKRGTPLIHLIPLTERTMEFQNHLVSPGEMETMNRSFNPEGCGFYPERKRLLARAVERMKADQKCPFSWLRRPGQDDN